MPATIESKIRALTESFTEELTALVRQAALESVEAAISGVYATAPRRGRAAGAVRKKATRKKAGRRKAGRRARRSPEDLDAQAATFLAHVRSNPGQRLEEIAQALGESTADLKQPVKLLLGARKVRTKGKARGTTYFAGAARGGKKKKATRKKATRKKATRKKATRKRAGRRKTRRPVLGEVEIPRPITVEAPAEPVVVGV